MVYNVLCKQPFSGLFLYLYLYVVCVETFVRHGTSTCSGTDTIGDLPPSFTNSPFKGYFNVQTMCCQPFCMCVWTHRHRCCVWASRSCSVNLFCPCMRASVVFLLWTSQLIPFHIPCTFIIIYSSSYSTCYLFHSVSISICSRSVFLFNFRLVCLFFVLLQKIMILSCSLVC